MNRPRHTKIEIDPVGTHPVDRDQFEIGQFLDPFAFHPQPAIGHRHAELGKPLLRFGIIGGNQFVLRRKLRTDRLEQTIKCQDGFGHDCLFAQFRSARSVSG